MPSNTEYNFICHQIQNTLLYAINTEYNFICHQIQNTILYVTKYRIQFYMPSNIEYNFI